MNVSILGDTSTLVQEVDIAGSGRSGKYDQAACSEQSSDSMLRERPALKNRDCWRVVRTRKSDQVEMHAQDKGRLDVENNKAVPERSC